MMPSPMNLSSVPSYLKILDHLLEVLVQHLDDQLWLCALAHAREAADVAVEHRALGHDALAALA
jgi:hypothetical protein